MGCMHQHIHKFTYTKIIGTTHWKFHNWWMWRTMAWCHLQTFPSCISLGHTHYQSLSWVSVSEIHLCKDKTLPFLKMNAPMKMTKLSHFLRINTPKRTKLCLFVGNEYTSKRAKCWHFWKLFVDVLDKICRTCYHTDPMFGTKTYYGVHASTHPQVHIHQIIGTTHWKFTLMHVENQWHGAICKVSLLEFHGSHHQPLSWMQTYNTPFHTPH